MFQHLYQTASIFTLFIFVCFTSCKKESIHNKQGADKQYYIKAKLNGEAIDFRSNATARFYSNNTFAGFARKEFLSAVPGFSMDLECDSLMVSKSYSKDQNKVSMMFRYYPNPNKIYYLYAATDHFTINILENTDQYIKGSFLGQITESADENDKLKVTDGEFMLLKE